MNGDSSMQYQSGAASLFAAMARGVKAAQANVVMIQCQKCLSDETEMVDHEHQIYRCCRCGRIFTRPAR
jgi:ribosomal protein S27E